MAQEGGTRRWWILAAMTGTLSMMMLDSTVVSVALPSIQADLDLTQTELQWVVNAYLLALAVFVAVAGRISDMFNRVHVMIAGVVLFVFFSAMCGLAQSDAWLISARALQGVGAALMIPPTATIVRQHVRSRRARQGDGDLRGDLDDLPLAWAADRRCVDRVA